MRRVRWQRLLHLLWTFLVVAIAASILLAMALSKPPSGQCEGIGWGCDLYGSDAAFFAAIFVVPIALTLLLVGNTIIAVVANAVRRRSNRSEALPNA